MKKSDRQITIWLLSGGILILTMIVIGGITRLTQSGLSMVDWNLIMGVVPPMNEAHWQTIFESYQKYPEFQQLNHRFTLQDFKSIFWLEYIHRLIGRVLGLVFIVPFVFFYFQKHFTKKRLRQSLVLFSLGILQGFLGWFMVKSGLVGNPHVSHFRLAVHLLTAFATCSYIFWIVLDIRSLNQPKSSGNPQIFKLLIANLVLIVLQIVYGAFVAGLNAGWGYNTFPLMNHKWIHPNVFNELSPTWTNFILGKAGVQFVHRYLAIAVLLFAIYLVWRGLKSSEPPKLIRALKLNLLVVCLQLALGIFTLILLIPISLAVIHQLLALMVLLSTVYLVHLYKSSPKFRSQNTRL